MTIEKALEILDINIKQVGKKMPPDVLIALIMAKGALQLQLSQWKLKE